MDSGLRLHPENWRDVSDNGKTLTRGMKVDILDAAVAYFYGRGSTLEMEILAEDPDADLLTAAAARYDKTRLQLLFSSQTARRAELRQQILTRMKEGFAVTVLDTPVTSEHEVNKILKEYDHRAANEKSPQPFHWRYRRTTSPEMH